MHHIIAYTECTYNIVSLISRHGSEVQEAPLLHTNRLFIQNKVFLLVCNQVVVLKVCNFLQAHTRTRHAAYMHDRYYCSLFPAVGVL